MQETSSIWDNTLSFFLKKLIYSFFVGIVLSLLSLSYYPWYHSDSLFLSHWLCSSLLIFYLFNRIREKSYNILYIFRDFFIAIYLVIVSGFDILTEEIENFIIAISSICLGFGLSRMLCDSGAFDAIVDMLWIALSKISHNYLSSPTPANNVVNFIFFYSVLSVIFIGSLKFNDE